MPEPLLGRDPCFLVAADLARKAALARSNTVIVGPVGSGKSHLARWSAGQGPDSGGPFIEWNAAAVPEALFEAELLGVEAGVATGVSGRPGICEAAGRGTLCFAGIERLSRHHQAVLLRVTEDRSLTRVGGRRILPLQARLVALFQERPEDLTAKGLLRLDLLYRLDLLRVELPPLAARRRDIPLFLRHFLKQAFRARRRRMRAVGDGLVAACDEHPWPGNLWEVRQVATFLAQSDSDPLGVEDLPPSFWLRADPLAEASVRRLTLSELKDAYIRQVLAKVGGNRTRAAQWLGISRKALWEHLKRGGG